MDLDTSSSVFQYSSAAVAGVVGIAFGFQKMLKGFKETSVESSVITMMHSELERLAKQNTTLSTEIHTLQQQIIDLNGQIGVLTIENHRLQTELSKLSLVIGNNSAASFTPSI